MKIQKLRRGDEVHDCFYNIGPPLLIVAEVRGGEVVVIARDNHEDSIEKMREEAARVRQSIRASETREAGQRRRRHRHQEILGQPPLTTPH